MLEKLELVEKRFGELEDALAQGDLYADPEKAARLLNIDRSSLYYKLKKYNITE